MPGILIDRGYPRRPPRAPGSGNAGDAREHDLLDLSDDLEGLAPFALPDVAAVDDARAAGAHDGAGLLEQSIVVDPGAARKHDEGAPRGFHAVADRVLLGEVALVVGGGGVLVLVRIDLG